jgi:hypothetical protein
MNPKARHSDIIVQEVGPDTLVYDELRDTAHSLGSVVGYVFKHADGSLPVAALATGLQATLDVPADPELVNAALWELDRAELLEQADPAPRMRRDISRREALQRFGAALSAVAITSIVAPTPAMARSYGDFGGSTGLGGSTGYGEEHGVGKGKGKAKGKAKGKGNGQAKRHSPPPGQAKKG